MEISQEEIEKRFKIILGGYCYAQDGGNNGYDYEDIKTFISQNFIPLSSLKKFIEENGEKPYEQIHSHDVEECAVCSWNEGYNEGHNSALKLLKDKFIKE